jgi:plasmid stabilization system protein ParE
MPLARKTANKKVATKAPVRKSGKPASPKSGVRKTAPPADSPFAQDSVALVERVARAVERELAEIEGIVGTLQGKAKPTEAERRARTLASLARTLSEVRRLRASEETQKPDDEPSAARNLEEFRKILFKRLEGMPTRSATLPAATDDAGGDV